MKKKYYSHMGFTLVELLIVIVVIGILSAMMMLSSTEAMSSAKAAKIISDLRNIKTAVTAWYADHIDKVDSNGNIILNNGNKEYIQKANANDSLGIGKYLNNESGFVLNEGTQDKLNAGTYGIYNVANRRSTWYVGYKFIKGEESVKEKLKGRAKSVGLIFSSEYPNPKNDDPKQSNDTGDSTVWMHVLGDLSTTKDSLN